MSNKLEFKIVEDQYGVKVKPDKITIGATDSLIILIQSLKAIAEETAYGDEFYIKLENGSLSVTGQFTEPHLNRMWAGIDQAFKNESSNEVIFSACKDLQKMVKANGLLYDFGIDHGGDRINLTSIFKESKTIKLAPRRVKTVTRVRFLKGELINAGGVYPNINVNVNGDEESKMVIRCTEAQAKKAINRLYDQIYFSCWCEYDFENRSYIDNKGLFCDLYDTEDRMIEYRDFYSNYIQKEEIESQEYLHYEIRNLIKHEKFGMVGKIMRLFTHNNSNIGSMRTLLVITKYFRDHEFIKDVRQEIKDKLELRIGKIL